MPFVPTSILMDAGRVVYIAMHHSDSISSDDSIADAPAPCGAPRQLGVCDTLLVGLVMWTLVHTTEALAGDQARMSGAAADPNFNDLRQSTPMSTVMSPIPDPFKMVAPIDADTFSADEFRPRRRSAPDQDSRAPTTMEAPLMRSTSVWQRLAESRAQNRVQVVTLWETGGNSLSLQAGRKGDPSLQWTSRLMGRGRTPHGLLDEFFSTSVGGVAGRGMQLLSRSVRGDASGKTVKPSVIAGTAGTK